MITLEEQIEFMRAQVLRYEGQYMFKSVTFCQAILATLEAVRDSGGNIINGQVTVLDYADGKVCGVRRVKLSEHIE